MLISIGNVDLTPYISQSSYNMNIEKIYESWLDGNYREHRIYTNAKVKGSFEISLYGQPLEGDEYLTTSNFLDLWNSNVTNEIVRIGVYIQNTDTFEVIDAYFDFEGTFHREMINGNYYDKLTITLTER